MKTITKNARSTHCYRQVTMPARNKSQDTNKKSFESVKKSKQQKAKDIFSLNYQFDNFFTKLIQ
jgi:hypothetical protein